MDLERNGATINLSEPGPQFLVFLERYAWDIAARWRMVETKNKEVVPGGMEAGLQLRNWEFMVGKYCVEPYLRDIEEKLRPMNADSGNVLMVEERLSVGSDESEKAVLWKKLGCWHCNRPLKISSQIFRGKQRDKETRRGRDRNKMMYGEIEKDGVSLETDNWIRGLFWYRPASDIALHAVPTSTSEDLTPASGIPLQSKYKVLGHSNLSPRRLIHQQLGNIGIRLQKYLRSRTKEALDWIDRFKWRTCAHFFHSWSRLDV